MSDEFKVQWSVSLPPAAQYAKGDMLNLRAQSVDELERIFNDVLDGEFIEKAAAVGALLRAAAVVTEGTAPAAAPAASQQAEGSNVTHLKTCNHGVREYKEGTNRQGKKWAGWFCPEKSKAAQCAVVWKD